MKLNIIDNRSRTMFMDLGYGEWFEIDGDDYVKIREVLDEENHRKLNAFSPIDGELCHICDGDVVHPYTSVEIVVE